MLRTFTLPCKNSPFPNSNNTSPKQHGCSKAQWAPLILKLHHLFKRLLDVYNNEYQMVLKESASVNITAHTDPPVTVQSDPPFGSDWLESKAKPIVFSNEKMKITIDGFLDKQLEKL